MHTVSVQFSGTTNTYHYMSHKVCAVGDTVVVDTPRNGLACARVTQFHKNRTMPNATKRIVQKVDTKDYEKYLQTQRAKADAKAKLDNLLKQVEETSKYKLLVEQFPEAAELIKTLES